MPTLPHCPAIRLQHSRSEAVMEAAGMRQSMMGVASNTSESNETPNLKADLIRPKKV